MDRFLKVGQFVEHRRRSYQQGSVLKLLKSIEFPMDSSQFD